MSIHVVYFRGFCTVTETLKGHHLEHLGVGRRLISLVNTQNVSVTKIADSSSIQRAETKYGLRIQFLALVVMVHEVWLNA